MASKSKVREITLVDEGGTFNTILKRFTGGKKEYDFDSLSALRRLLSNQKARLLHVIKTQAPNSIYSLAKILKRDFKSVSQDIKLLERFSFVDLVSEKTGNRERLKPVLAVDSIYLQIKL